LLGKVMIIVALEPILVAENSDNPRMVG